MMKFRIKKVNVPIETHTCRNCGHVFSGKVCNICGEKIFSEKQLSTGHFFHQVIDFFLHFESKVLKTIKLNIIKPGFVTMENLRGVRVPYAKPVQLYLVVSVVFFIAVAKIGRKDYIPSKEDHHYYPLSDYAMFKWAKPLDDKIVATIDTLEQRKYEEVVQRYDKWLRDGITANGSKSIYNMDYSDSIVVNSKQVPVIAAVSASTAINTKFNQKVSAYGKTLVFLVLPFFALIFFLMFFKKLKYYGAALILSTHFMVYNLCFYVVYIFFNFLPGKFLGSEAGGWIYWPLDKIFYNPVMAPVTNLLVSESFELIHLLFWMPWLVIAFKRLFNLRWWLAVPAAYFCSRIFFYLIFGVLKKALIAYTVWSI
jgi:Protein of unknown function (DUF3667)